MQSPRDFNANLSKVVAAGLTEEQALAALTTTPAKLLGIERIAGTLEAGKLANLLIVEDELFAEKPKLRHLFVNGYHEEFEAEATIGDPECRRESGG